MVKILRIVGDVAVVTATADFHPLRQLPWLEAELRTLNFEGSVLFDLLAVNGMTPNRFASMQFSEGCFERKSFAVELSVGTNIRAEQDSVAKSDQTFLLGSVLSSSEVEEFRH